VTVGDDDLRDGGDPIQRKRAMEVLGVDPVPREELAEPGPVHAHLPRRFRHGPGRVPQKLREEAALDRRVTYCRYISLDRPAET
jgi:hypothetical protein